MSDHPSMVFTIPFAVPDDLRRSENETGDNSGVERAAQADGSEDDVHADGRPSRHSRRHLGRLGHPESGNRSVRDGNESGGVDYDLDDEARPADSPSRPAVHLHGVPSPIERHRLLGHRVQADAPFQERVAPQSETPMKTCTEGKPTKV
ncbi:unnamed protein product [Nesidiocoris tenuis]|uniref:Uncharacterized protein n=1 Tax=Nesidiocoris tenuis TaxID=355587 RepID=A0A6H5GRH3_9HEMI|nr:unnamed protein product [Nesidiocoris tenuis]